MIAAGQQIGGYTVLHLLGRGGMGEVYLAQHRRVARRAAIKVLVPELSQNAVVLERTLPCRPCFKRVCPLGHLNCLNLIGAEEVAGHLVAQVERTTSVSIA